MTVNTEQDTTKKVGKANFNELARFVKDHQDLFDVIKQNLIPDDLPPNVAPTDQWIKELA